MGLCQAREPPPVPSEAFSQTGVEFMSNSFMSTKNTVEPKNEFSWWTTWFQNSDSFVLFKVPQMWHIRGVFLLVVFLSSDVLWWWFVLQHTKLLLQTGLRQPGWKTCEPPSFLRLPNTDLFSLKKRTVISQGPTTNTKKALWDEEDVLNEVCGGLQTF